MTMNHQGTTLTITEPHTMTVYTIERDTQNVSHLNGGDALQSPTAHYISEIADDTTEQDCLGPVCYSIAMILLGLGCLTAAFLIFNYLGVTVYTLIPGIALLLGGALIFRPSLARCLCGFCFKTDMN